MRATFCATIFPRRLRCESLTIFHSHAIGLYRPDFDRPSLKDIKFLSGVSTFTSNFEPKLHKQGHTLLMIPADVKRDIFQLLVDPPCIS